MFALASLLLLQVQLPGPPEHKISNLFHAGSTPGRLEFNYSMLVFAITGVMFVVVASLIISTMIRFRRKADDPNEPPQVYGSNRIEAAWTVIPILVVFVLAGVTARVVWGVQDASPPANTLHVKVIGHQYWWEVEYPFYNVKTANEIHIPVSHNHDNASYFELTSKDVIHSFWAPDLGGKTDLIPGRLNHMWLDPAEAGVYWGSCTEFCGVQHAQMLMQVVAQEPDDFQKWIKEQQQGHPLASLVSTSATPTVEEAAAQRGSKKFMLCAGCHAVQGTPFRGMTGPDLTHVASRRQIGSGILANTPENLKAWLKNPQDAKPGCLMPDMKLAGTNLDDITAYMETLK